MADEVRRIVEWLRVESCNSCIFSRLGDCRSFDDCLERTAADLIESLSAELEQVKQERDAAVEDLRSAAYCGDCVNYTTAIENEPCKACLVNRGFTKPNWQWRGVKEDRTS
jgi:hypothetical protein